MRTVLYPEWLLDGTGAPARGGCAVSIADGLIEAVAPAAELVARDEDEVVRAAGHTLLPGLINMHAHLSLTSDNAPFVPYMDAHSDVALALRAAHNARVALRAGVTTMRDCGARRTTVLEVRDGPREGARIVSCGWPLTISGGHMRPFGGEVDGALAARQMVRRLVGAGADFIKVAGSGGGTPGSLPDLPSFLPDELGSIVETAHGLGRRVTVHCTATAAIANALAARVDSIEHGYFSAPGAPLAFDERLADGLAAAGIPITPTVQVARDMVDALPAGAERDAWRRRRDACAEMVRRLHRHGVRLLVGSDAGWRYTRFDDLWREMDELVGCGVPPLAVIHGATGAASDAIGRAGEFGTIRPGLSADRLLVPGDVARDVRLLAHVGAVYLRGARSDAPTATPSSRGA
jgi:imidazolonepropionase-like amidohydrolase